MIGHPLLTTLSGKKHLANCAMPGNLVYIHYSSHEIRRDIKLRRASEGNISGTALTPMDVMCGGA